MSAFETAVEVYCRGLTFVAIGCRGEQCEYAEGDPDHQCEASFGRGQCDSCGSGLAGDRIPAVGGWTGESGELCTIEMEVCIDCALYHANGDLPDEWSDSPW